MAHALTFMRRRPRGMTLRAALMLPPPFDLLDESISRTRRPARGLDV